MTEQDLHCARGVHDYIDHICTNCENVEPYNPFTSPQSHPEFKKAVAEMDSVFEKP